VQALTQANAVAHSLKKGLRRRLRQNDGPLDTPWRRFVAHVDLMIFDFGAFRLLRPNWHRIADGIYRSAQPSPRLLRRAERNGVRTVINLRGADNGGAYKLEQQACEVLGMTLIDLRMKSREIPDGNTLETLRDILLTAEKPLLFHCKSGADRAGLVGALYLLWAENRPANEALSQLHWRYGHFKRGMPGILTTFLEVYRDEGESKGLDIITWRRTSCTPEAINRRFRSHPLARLLTDSLLRRE
jgi:protein tyrosine phosphatase (PTP) superfamily phosphohydrolase (DUF442 family)